jgi:hypothetical protein
LLLQIAQYLTILFYAYNRKIFVTTNGILNFLVLEPTAVELLLYICLLHVPLWVVAALLLDNFEDFCWPVNTCASICCIFGIFSGAVEAKCYCREANSLINIFTFNAVRETKASMRLCQADCAE